jgi:hypothetical protein
VPQSANLTGRAEPQRIRAGFVSDNFFEVVGVQPVIGRGFRAGVDDAERAPRVCVVQHETWQSLFGGDAALVGRSIVVNNEPVTVVGILPQGFRFPYDEVEVWMPYHTWPVYQEQLARGMVAQRTNGLVAPIGRMKPGVRLRSCVPSSMRSVRALPRSTPREARSEGSAFARCATRSSRTCARRCSCCWAPSASCC